MEKLSPCLALLPMRPPVLNYSLQPIDQIIIGDYINQVLVLSFDDLKIKPLSFRKIMATTGNHKSSRVGDFDLHARQHLTRIALSQPALSVDTPPVQIKDVLLQLHDAPGQLLHRNVIVTIGSVGDHGT